MKFFAHLAREARSFNYLFNTTSCMYPYIGISLLPPTPRRAAVRIYVETGIRTLARKNKKISKGKKRRERKEKKEKIRDGEKK